MALYYFIALIFVIWNIIDVQTHHGDHDRFPHKPPPPPPPQYDGLLLPSYGAYLIGFTMLIMLIAIIILSVLLYYANTNKKLLPITENRKYTRQETTGQITYSATNAENNVKNGSEIMVNSQFIEIEAINEPQTLPRPYNNKITYNKSRLRVPDMHRQQIDEICRYVLDRSKKTVSSSMRELNELQKEIEMQNPKGAKEIDEIKPELSKASSIQIYEINNDKKKEQHQVENMEQKEAIKENQAVGELEIYDTVPAPVRASEDTEESEYMPVYDNPPSQTHMLVLDTDTDYLMPITCRPGSYVNAHTPY